MTDYAVPEWPPRLTPSEALLPHNLQSLVDQIGQIYADTMKRQPLAVRLVVEHDHGETAEMRIEVGPDLRRIPADH